MFEPGKEEEKSSSAGMFIGIGVVVALLVVGGIIYMNHGSSSAPGSSTASSSSAAPSDGSVQGRDPVKDLHVVSATVTKTPAGGAQWTIDIKNQSDTASYKSVSYQTAYMGLDNSVLRQGQGKFPLAIGPDEEQTTQVQDGVFPPKTAWYKFTVTYDMGQ